MPEDPPLLDAVNPEDGRLWQLRLSLKLMEDVKRHSTIRLNELCFLVPEAVRSPARIYQGLRDKQDHWLCYVHKAKCSFRGPEGHRCPPWAAELFLVFVNEDKIIYNFTWVPWDPDDHEAPQDGEARFGAKRL